MTLNPDTIWTKVYQALATNSATKITDPNTTRSDPTKAVFSSYPDYSEHQYYPIFIIEPPTLNEVGYSINSATHVAEGNITIQTFDLSSANLKRSVNVIKAGVRSAKNWLEGQGVKIMISPDVPMFEDDAPDNWLEGGKKIHFQLFTFRIKSTGTS